MLLKNYAVIKLYVNTFPPIILAYMMVTSSVQDQRNGGHSHAGSPLPIKKYDSFHVEFVRDQLI